MATPVVTQEIRRILYIRTDRIGDVLMNLPAIRLLRQTFPKAWITLILDDSVADLLKSHPDLDEVLPVSSKGIKKSLRYRVSLIQEIKKTKFDLGVVANPDKFLHALLFFSKIHRRVGYDRKMSFFLTDRAPVDKVGNDVKHEIDKNIDLVRLISNQNWDGSLALPADAAAKKLVQDRLKSALSGHAQAVVVHPGTSNPGKRWPESKFAQLGDQIQSDKNLKVILVGGEEETVCSKNVAAQMKSQVLDWTGTLNLKQLAALFHIPEVKLLISVDSGPVHIAWISGTPVVALYAKNTTGSDPHRWGPKDKKSEVIFKPIQEITVDEVWLSAKRVLGKN